MDNEKKELYRDLDIEDEVNDTIVKVRIVKPTVEDSRRADWEYSKTFNESLMAKLYTESEMINLLKERKVWTDDDEQVMNRIRAEIASQVSTLLNSTELTLSQKVELKQAISINRLSLLLKHNALQSIKAHTCEAKADEARIIYLSQKCVRNRDTASTPYWETLDAVRNESNQELAQKLFQAVVMFMNAMPSDINDMFPENKVEIDFDALAKEEEAAKEKQSKRKSKKIKEEIVEKDEQIAVTEPQQAELILEENIEKAE